MKIFDLLCGAGHRFEGWFASAEEFAAQKANGQIGCPSCGAVDVDRVPSATRFNTGAAQAGQDPLALAQKLYSRMLDDLLTRSEDVGSGFPEEARRIHRQEVPARMIRGQATKEEHESLVEEGVPVMRLPIPPTGRWN
jgi:hypothetical protein